MSNYAHCPECGSTDFFWIGSGPEWEEEPEDLFECHECGAQFSEPDTYDPDEDQDSSDS